MKKQSKTYIIFGIVLVLIIILSSYITFSYNNSKIERIEDFNKYYSKGLTDFNNAIFDNYNAEFNYDSWSFYYNEGYYYDSIEYCVAARELYVSSSSYHQNSISYFEEANKVAKEQYNELVNYYIKASDQAIEINWAMYEACEYFESASSLYDQGFLESGDSELEIGNTRIELHDSLIRDYNKYISKIEILGQNI